MIDTSEGSGETESDTCAITAEADSNTETESDVSCEVTDVLP